jgi:hypothetical protein
MAPKPGPTAQSTTVISSQAAKKAMEFLPGPMGQNTQANM